MADRPAPGASADSISAELIENRGFTVTRRGFDQDEVKEFLQVVAGAIRALHERVDGLHQELSDAEFQVNNPKLDEDTLMRLVGDETGSILRSARATAAEMSANADRRAQEMREAVERECAQLRELVEREVDELRARAEHEIEAQRATILAETLEERGKAERETAAMRQSADAETNDLRARAAAEAARVVDEARQAAGELREQAETVHARATEEAEQAAARIRNTATESAEQVVRRARTEADVLRQQAEHDRKLTVEGAQALREKILTDLTRRRRVASTQVEQLRAGRERLLQSYGLVRRTLEEINDELHRADEEARQAAADAGAAYEAKIGDDAVAPDLLEAVPLPASLASPDSGTGESDKGAPESRSVPAPAGEPVSTDRTGGGSSGTQSSGTQSSGTQSSGTRSSGTQSSGTQSSGSKTSGSGATVRTAKEAGVAKEAVGEGHPAVPPSPPSPLKTTGSGGAATAVEARPDTESDAAEDDSAESEQLEPAEGEETEADEPAAVAAAPSGRRRRGGGVDDLFARLRAGREVAVSQARTVLAGSAGSEAVATVIAAGEPSNGVVVADPAIQTTDDEFGAQEMEAGEETEAGQPRTGRRRTDLELEPARSNEEEGWLQRRDEALGRVERALTRKLKRAMQDEQNDLLDRLRSLPPRPTPDSLLPPLVEQEARFSRAASGPIDQGAQAGVKFALSILSEHGRETAPPGTPPAVDEIDEQLAAAIVTPLRHRLAETIAENDDDDQAVLVDALGAAYREWKTQRLERIAGDALADAFAHGVVHATPPSVSLQWVVDDVDGPCSDCDDNVLAGALSREEAFPTGQLLPPAHAGCRCIVVPSV